MSYDAPFESDRKSWLSRQKGIILENKEYIRKLFDEMKCYCTKLRGWGGGNEGKGRKNMNLFN